MYLSLPFDTTPGLPAVGDVERTALRTGTEPSRAARSKWTVDVS